MRRLAVFASGSGTNFEAIATACERGEIPARVVLMVCDKPGAGVVQRAAGHGVEAFVLAPKEYASKADYEREIVRRLDQAGVELVCLAGYMRIVGDVLLGLTADGSSTSTLRCCRHSAGRMPSNRRWNTASRSSV